MATAQLGLLLFNHAQRELSIVMMEVEVLVIVCLVGLGTIVLEIQIQHLQQNVQLVIIVHLAHLHLLKIPHLQVTMHLLEV